MTGIERANARIIDEFLTSEEQAHFLALANQYRADGVLEANPSGPLRLRAKVYGTEYCDAEMTRVGARIIETFGLAGFPVDRYLGWIISFIEPGGFIKPHIDRQPHYQETSDKHLRCNVLVQGPDASAYPLVGAQRLKVSERGLWAFFASEHPHGTQVLQGDQPRIVYQFGFCVPSTYSLDQHDN
jgi:hypothetical protein